MYDLNQKVVTEKNFGKYCKRNYILPPGGTEADVTSKCERSLNPSLMFFSDVSPSTVDLNLFKPTASMEKHATCFLSKLTLSAEAFPMVKTCQDIDFANVGPELAQAQRLVLSIYHWMGGCGAFQRLKLVDLTLDAEATRASINGETMCKPTALPTPCTIGKSVLEGGCMRCNMPADETSSKKFVVVMDTELEIFHGVRFDGMTAATEAAQQACSANATTTQGWGRSTKMQDVTATLTLAGHMKTNSALRYLVDLYFDKDFSLANLQSKYSRSYDFLGFPLGVTEYQEKRQIEQYRSSEDRQAAQDKEVGVWFQDNFRSAFR